MTCLSCRLSWQKSRGPCMKPATERACPGESRRTATSTGGEGVAMLDPYASGRSVMVDRARPTAHTIGTFHDWRQTVNSTPIILDACQEIAARMSAELLRCEIGHSGDGDPRLIEARQRGSEDGPQVIITIPVDWVRCLRADCDQLSKLIDMISVALDPDRFRPNAS